MGSSRPPNLDMPFGYSFDAASQFPFPSPTAPAPGPSLLDDNESKLLDSFFDGVSSDQFNYDFFNNPADGSELGHGWDEIPPAFMGTSSSFGQHPQMLQHERLPEQSFGHMNSHMNAGPSIPVSTSADVLAAASVLQNGSVARSHSMSDGVFRGHDIHSTNEHTRAQSMSLHPSRMQPGFSQRSDDYMRDTFFTDMVFGGQPESAMRQQPGSSRKVDIHWGSDIGFSAPQGFIASSNHDPSSGNPFKQIVDNALSLHIPSSAETSQPPSPTLPMHPMTVPNANGIEDAHDSGARKRGKSKLQEATEEAEEAPVTTKSAKKRKSGKKAAVESPAPESESNHKRRKSTAAAAAKARENLTEDQKRENHIKSEQKRRTLIREGFEDLGELVPGLRGGGFSKSAVLTMAADWLEDLLKGNEALKIKLEQMEGK
ncbi:bHLH family transcription factor [Diplocarpon rosae]|nr:bHLH family transcription factor [Diplocarpon rosae]